jgi:two-component system sensor histidine kinase ChvG
LSRRLAGSRIARLIFISNFCAFAILAIGVLTLTELRTQLVRAKIESLFTQARLITEYLAENATIGEPAPELMTDRVGYVLQRLNLPETQRLRVFAPDGAVLVDSALAADRVGQRELPRADDRAERRPGWRLANLPEQPLREEVAAAARGAPVSNARVNADGQRVVSVSLPVAHVKAVLGVLTLESNDIDSILAEERRARTPFILGAGVLILLSSTLLAIVIARPLRRLALAADNLRASGGTRLSPPADIISRKDEIGHLAQALERLTGALSERIEANASFAADVSHEIKNPLTSIRSAVETARGVTDSAARERLLGVIAADVRRLDRLITDMSRASRLEAETAFGGAAAVDIARLLSELCQTYQATRADGAAVHYSGEAWSVWVKGLDGPLGQVFRNLVDNARSFSPPGGEVWVRLEVAGPREKRCVRVVVEDSGPGIPPDNLETIFQRFYTQRPQGAAFGGNSGLGLSIARQIVQAHKGRIWAENRADGGARFVVELPLAGEGAALGRTR